MSDDLLWLLAGVLALRAWERWQRGPAQALQQGGAQLYEALHPAERGHASDLPGHQMTKAAIVALAQLVGFPDPNLAAAIALAESGGVPNALGDGGVSVGLWQINTRAHPSYGRAELADPKVNARAAYVISKGGTDWRPWSVFRTGKYGAYL